MIPLVPLLGLLLGILLAFLWQNRHGSPSFAPNDYGEPAARYRMAAKSANFGDALMFDRMRSQPSRFADLSSLPRSAPSYARMLGRLERKPPPWNEAAMLRAANRRRFS